MPRAEEPAVALGRVDSERLNLALDLERNAAPSDVAARAEIEGVRESALGSAARVVDKGGAPAIDVVDVEGENGRVLKALLAPEGIGREAARKHLAKRN